MALNTILITSAVVICMAAIFAYGWWNTQKHQKTDLRIDDIDVEIESINKKYYEVSQDILDIKLNVISTKKSVDWIKNYLQNKN